jgi:cruciform cutting endonuclease 1
MRPSAALYSTNHAWLGSLKSAQLQRIARATGIQSSGTKSVLVERIATEFRSQQGVKGCSTPTSSKSKPKSVGLSPPSTDDDAQSKQQAPWSILSIDMGIQNLAFAHLHVPHPRSPGSTCASLHPDQPLPLEVTAWHKLSVSEISSLNLTPASSDNPPTPSETTLPIKISTSKEKEKKKENYTPSLYAQNAYKLITSLLEAYKPTHILIERQRFRSGGGSAVQEWTLRVGVFEGMLYAIIHALREERGGPLQDVVVHGIEPRRVVRYWLEGSTTKDTTEKGDDGKPKRFTARDVKKAKIDLVAGWLSSAMKHQDLGSGDSEDRTMDPGLFANNKIVLANPSESRILQDVASGFLLKWHGQVTRKTKAAKKKKKDRKSVTESLSADPVTNGEILTPASDYIDPGKLDDLADCLLQGVTWVEWQAMRERIAREGVKALESIPV